MRENPYGFPSSAGRFATGLLPFRYTVRPSLSSLPPHTSGRRFRQGAAGMNPAVKATLVSQTHMRENPDGFPSSAGRFATGLLPFRYTVRPSLSSLPPH